VDIERQMHAIVAVIRAEVRRREDDAIHCLRSLLAASRDGEDAVQAEVASRLGELDCEPRLIRASGAVITAAGEIVAPHLVDDTMRTSVAGRLGAGESGPALMLWAHPDGMPFDNARGWTRDPFAGEIVDGRMYGWGIADDLSGVAAALMTADVLRSLGLRLGGELVIASTPSKGHASGVLAVLDSGVRVDAGIYLHPAESGNGLRDIKALAPGMLRFRLRVAGEGPATAEPNHALYAHQAADPIELMRRLLNALRDLDERRATSLRNAAMQAFAGRSTNMLISSIHGGESPSRVAQSCEALITFVTPPGEVIEDVRDEISQTIWTLASDDPWLRHQPPEIEWLFGTTGVQVAETDALYQTVAGAVQSVTGVAPRYYPGHTASEIRQPILNYGIPAVGIGPLAGALTQAGNTDEWLDVRDYLRMITICAAAACRWCGVVSDDIIDIPPHLLGDRDPGSG
jgi:acetylornithine deacetylase